MKMTSSSTQCSLTSPRVLNVSVFGPKVSGIAYVTKRHSIASVKCQGTKSLPERVRRRTGYQLAEAIKEAEVLSRGPLSLHLSSLLLCISTSHQHTYYATRIIEAWNRPTELRRENPGPSTVEKLMEVPGTWDDASSTFTPLPKY